MSPRWDKLLSSGLFLISPVLNPGMHAGEEPPAIYTVVSKEKKKLEQKMETRTC